MVHFVRAVGSSTVNLRNPIQRFARDMRVALTHRSTRLDPTAEISKRMSDVEKALGKLTKRLDTLDR